MPPKQRPGRTPTNAGTGRNPLVLFAAVGGAIVVGALVFLIAGRGSDTPSEDARTALEAAGCTLKLVPAPAVGAHVSSPDFIGSTWNTDPPTAGPHYGEPAIYGAYDEPVQPARLVHNLEHGGVFMLYGKAVPPGTVDELRQLYQQNLNGTVLAPYPKLGKKIALGAWLGSGGGSGTGVLATCPTFSETAFQGFFDAYQFKGREAFPPSSMAPGSR